MAYSIVGNQNPDGIPAEVDSSKAEQVVVIPPFGSQNYVYYIIAISIVIVLAIGIVLIKTKVLRRKDTL